MSLQDSVADILQEENAGKGSLPDTSTADVVALALQEVNTLLESTGDSMLSICKDIEGATTKALLRSYCRRFNGILRIFLELAPAREHDVLVKEAICSLQVSRRLKTLLGSAASVPEALTAYKTGVVQELAATLRRKGRRTSLDEEKDDVLFSRFLPEPSSLDSEDGMPTPAQRAQPAVGQSSRKRRASAIAEEDVLVKIPKKSSIPALAALERAPGGGGDGMPVKKHVLLTRQKLRAGLHDPKGLLSLVDSSTNALERTKRLELLKSSGRFQKFQGKYNRKQSFPELLNEAAVRLDVGLGGHSVSDTLLFGASVLHAPGFLTPKNVSDIENNIVDGKTTWRHQNAYGKMVIAGCLNQSKRIIEKFDEILHGSKPEVLIQGTHDTIKRLLTSDECRAFLRDVDSTEESPVADCDTFIRRIVEAVAPIVPITLRNDSLDGGYLRTALHLLGAAEMLFGQYESDVRIQANPAGVVGMATAMHGEFERAVVFNEELRSLNDFIKDMKSQYQTSLGLGAPFAKDSGGRTRRRNTNNRGREFYRSRRHQSMGLDRSQQTLQSAFTPTGQFQHSVEPNLAPPVPIRGRGAGRGVCYAYQAGACRRGNSCRFLHLNQ